MRNNLFVISKSGWPYLGCAFLAFILFSFVDLDFFAFVSLVLFGLVIYLFRNPERALPFYETNSVVAPCDGVVLSIENLENSKYSYKIDVDSSYLNVAILRAPMNAKVQNAVMTQGARLSRKSKLFEILNENIVITFVNNQQKSIKLLHRVKQSFAPITLELTQSQELMQSARYGVMINGVTSIYLESDFRVNVHVGEEIKASQTLMGYFS